MTPPRALAIPTLCLLGLCSAGGEAAPEAGAAEPGRASETVIELLELGSDLVAGDRMPLRTTSSAESKHLVQAGAGAVEIFLLAPPRSRLVAGIAQSTPSSQFSVEVVSDDGSKTLVGERKADEWQASLEPFSGRPIKLRFVNRGSATLTWEHPRVIGTCAEAASILELGPAREKRPLNVVLYLIDTLRADRLSFQGYARKTSPRMDALAARSIVFTNAYSPGSYTLPSVTSLFGSRFPSALNGRLTPGEIVPETLTESFRKAGYATAAFQANSLVKSITTHHERGFDVYRAFPMTGKSPKQGFVAASTLHRSALHWVRKHAAAPFFLYLQSMDVHGPHPAPEPWEQKFVGEAPVPGPVGLAHKPVSTKLSDRYDGRLAYQDHEIGRLLARLRNMQLAHDTAIIVTSDHGEPLGERGHILHGHSLFEELVHIPLIMDLPGEPPRRIADVVSLMDLGPTILDIAGIPKPDGLVGHSMLEPRACTTPATAYGELMRPKTLEIHGWYVRQGEWKLIMNRKGEKLFHLPTDPTEDSDKSDQYPVTTGYLAALARANSPALQSGATQPPMSPEEARKMEEELRAIGYID
ncbi:MAG: sulfatase [Deltaproteobacteria bacterium]|nr:sulfatase [Deltaproteobacteria bacterium]